MKEAVSVSTAPEAIGPYSQAILGTFSHFVFTSGQLGMDPATGELVTGGIKVEAERAFENLKAVLNGAGLDFAHVVKVTVFLKSIEDFAALNEVYARFFQKPFPARSCFAVGALPKGAAVEIEAVAAH
jgi:2-iminobutanoate/2-iminopropanoate deaminase